LRARYDAPKAPLEPLRQVQLFVNSQDVEHEMDWLDNRLAERDIVSERARAAELRTALHSLLLTNNGCPLDPLALETINVAAVRVPLQLDGGGLPRLDTGGPLDEIVAVALTARLDGTGAG
jgi:hypothetical protein